MRARFTLLLSKAEREAVEGEARRRGLAVGAYIRMAIMERVDHDRAAAKPINLFGGEEEER